MPSPQPLLLSTLVLTLVLNNVPASTSNQIQINSRLSEQSVQIAQRGYSKRPYRGIGRRERLAMSTLDSPTLPVGIASVAPTHIEHLRNT